SIVGPECEVEHDPAVSFWAARLPETARVRPIRLEHAGGDVVGWPESLEGSNLSDATLIAICDPFSFPTDAWIKNMNETAPGLEIVGGVASGGHSPESNRLLLDDDVYSEGAVGLLLEGLKVPTVVSQGCRPIGRHLIVTSAEGNVIQELGRRPAVGVLRE